MQPNYISIANLFGVQTRYTVPLFQRPYVWSKAEQWEPLWDDLEKLAERVLSVEPDKPIAGHFLGTVVLEQTPVSIVNLPRREVIDGQQRLTTLQIVLKAAEHALFLVSESETDPESIKTIRRASEQLGFLTRNVAPSSEEEAFKVWPTNEDRKPFQSVMTSNPAIMITEPASRMAEAYRYFREAFAGWLSGTYAPNRAQALAAALKDHLRIIVLDLDDTDEPQAIFETLNAHGTPLLPADLIKNWLLWEASAQKLEVNALYETYWRPFDRDAGFWRGRTGTGHAARPRVDTFFQNWLTRRTKKAVSPKHIYDEFLRHMVSAPPSSGEGKVPNLHSTLADIRDDALRFREIQAPVGNSRFDCFLRRLHRLDVVVFFPFILAVMGRRSSDAVDRDRIAVALESYLVRRMICNLQTRGYGALVLELLDVLEAVDEALPAAPDIIQALANQTSSLLWPDDVQFQKDFTTRRFYNSLRKDRVLMILEAIEELRQAEMVKSEPYTIDYSKLTIEHVLPVAWQRHWPLAEGVTHEERDYLLHGVGNLTLVSEKLNPAMSNAPWTPTNTSKNSKRAALQAHSKLELNASLVRDNEAVWNESCMAQRAGTLFTDARQIWPLPGST